MAELYSTIVEMN